MTPNKQSIIKFLENRFSTVLSAPLNFGSLVSAEYVFYFTLETYLYSVFGTSENDVADHYDLFLRKQFGENQASLSACVERSNYHLSDLEKAKVLSNLLGRFKDICYQKELKKRAKTRPMKKIRDDILIEPNPKLQTQKIIIK